LIFHASLVGQAPQKLKGKMARMVATKAALSIRLDALADADSKDSLDAATIGIESRAKLETRLRLLEQGIGHTSLRSIAKSHDAKAGNQKKFEMNGSGAAYNDAADTLVPTGTTSAVKIDDEEEEKKKAKKEKKEKKRKAEEDAEEVTVDVEMDVVEDDVSRIPSLSSRWDEN
jgi:nucleolar protein 58